MSVRVRAAPSPRLWTVVRRMQLKSSPGTTSTASVRQRPDTATLDRPAVLDPGLLRKVDMTRLTRDRLMTIENLVTTPKKTKNSPKSQEKHGKISRSRSREREDEESSNVEDFNPRKNSRVNNATFRVRSHFRKGLREVFASPTQLRSSPSPGKEVHKVKSPKGKDISHERREKKNIEDVFGTLINNPPVPSPCSTCGRAERPERLHAHPSVPRSKRSKLRDDVENSQTEIRPQAPRSSVTKPVAMKFRSGKNRGDKSSEMSKTPSPEEYIVPAPKDIKEQKKATPLIRRETFKIDRSPKLAVSPEKKISSSPPSPLRKASLLMDPPPRRPALPRTPEKQSPRELSPPLAVPEAAQNPVVHSGSHRRPRTVTCYLCLKQFGTASYPKHEPQCLQRWHRENQALPVSQQQQEPLRPSDQEMWDNAWEVAQAAMVACDGCPKTFLPHRLIAHQRVCPQSKSCKSSSKQASPPQQQSQASSQLEERGWESDRSERSVLTDGPPTVHCHICGRVFNRSAVERHEQQCLKRWQLENSSRESGSSAPASATSSPPSTPSRRRLVLCYLCGRQFGTASIAIHEPQCLRKWRQENERLPPSQRRAEPHRPAPILDSETGQIDYQATEEAQWQCHLVQLVPCGKCGRTFNPDRVIVHEKCCKGPAAKH